VPKYKVTGGPSGESGVEVDGKSYEVGDVFDSNAKGLKWLVDEGYLSTGSAKKSAASKATSESDNESQEGED
jgi:hypothetical protein